MIWELSHRFDRRALPLANRHYNRQTPGSPQFVPPGRCLVLLTACGRALWVTSWPEFAQHDWPGAWVNTLFRNEGAGLSSDLIREAVAATRWRWPNVPRLGMVTFIDPGSVRRKRDPGRCYLRAGFEDEGKPTKVRKRISLRLRPNNMPAAEAPGDAQQTLWSAA